MWITYNINNSKPGETFEVDLVVKDPSGKSVSALTLSGDFGEGVKGGSYKRIIWEFSTDKVTNEKQIIVKLVAAKEQGLSTSPLLSTTPKTKTYTRSGLILQSLALPGLGMTKLKKKPYWIMGVAAYGTLSFSLYYWYKSELTWDEYLAAASGNDFETAVSKNNQYQDEYQIALITTCGAAAIWLTDFLIISIASKNMNNSAYINFKKKVQIIPGYDINTRSPMLSMTYKF